ALPSSAAASDVYKMQNLREDQVRLFAGAGIVPASSPLGEWRETGVKLSTMLNVFGLH
ncbi:hypothetical protein F8B21_26130, partial [Escherichia coli]